MTNFFPFCTIGISMYQKRTLPYIIIPYFLTPSFFPFGALQTEGRTTFFTPRYLSSFFFPLSARGPTRRRNFTGLAELWGGWPIEQADRGFATSRLCVRSDEDGTILAHNNTRFRLVSYIEKGGERSPGSGWNERFLSSASLLILKWYYIHTTQ